MYQRFFGFSRPLFSDGLAQDEAVFMPESREAVAADFEIALTRKDSIAVLGGPSGTGKSTLATHALRSISTRLAFCCLSEPPLTPHELLEQLLSDFGFEPYKLSRVERLQVWRQFLSEMTATDTRVCILVERAESFAPELLVALHRLTAADATPCAGANIVLTTTGNAEALLAADELQPLNQRVRLRRTLAPLTVDETRDYLAFKCAFGDADAAKVFSDDVAASLHQLSGGALRMIDNLLESTLSTAAARSVKPVTALLLEGIASDQFGIAIEATASEIDRLLQSSAAPAPVEGHARAANQVAVSVAVNAPNSEIAFAIAPISDSDVKLDVGSAFFDPMRAERIIAFLLHERLIGPSDLHRPSLASLR
ncbi:MAG: AAA family ATPase, partial [Gammaproteobacteria bacterium]|nr:AAA family ATPase [Gammaproteobacteria bacterium]